MNRLGTGYCPALKLLSLPLQLGDHFKTKCGAVHTNMGRIWLAAPGLTEVREGSVRGVISSGRDLPSVRGSYELGVGGGRGPGIVWTLLFGGSSIRAVRPALLLLLLPFY